MIRTRTISYVIRTISYVYVLYHIILYHMYTYYIISYYIICIRTIRTVTEIKSICIRIICIRMISGIIRIRMIGWIKLIIRVRILRMPTVSSIPTRYSKILILQTWFRGSHDAKSITNDERLILDLPNPKGTGWVKHHICKMWHEGWSGKSDRKIK